MSEPLRSLITRWREDPGATYRAWFLWEERLVEAIRQLDARKIKELWLGKGSAEVAAGFEVEHTTSIYSGIVRLLDLALGASSSAAQRLYLVAPDARLLHGTPKPAACLHTSRRRTRRSRTSSSTTMSMLASIVLPSPTSSASSARPRSSRSTLRTVST